MTKLQHLSTELPGRNVSGMKRVERGLYLLTVYSFSSNIAAEGFDILSSGAAAVASRYSKVWKSEM
jgi:hypothetical protein